MLVVQQVAVGPQRDDGWGQGELTLEAPEDELYTRAAVFITRQRARMCLAQGKKAN